MKRLCECFGSFFEAKYEDIRYDSYILGKLQTLGWDINHEECGGPGLFYKACENDDIEKLNILIEQGIDLVAYGSEGLNLACQNCSRNALVRLKMLDINFGPYLMNSLIRNRNVKSVELAIEYGFDVNEIIHIYFGERPIHYAVKYNSMEILELLVRNGADYHAVNRYGDSILHYAAFRLKPPMFIEYFYESGFDMNVQNEHKETPLMRAVSQNNEAVFKYLVNVLDNFDQVDVFGFTALNLSIYRGLPEFAKILILKGAKVNIKNNFGMTALHSVKSFSSDRLNSTVELLLDHGA